MAGVRLLGVGLLVVCCLVVGVSCVLFVVCCSLLVVVWCLLCVVCCALLVGCCVSVVCCGLLVVDGFSGIDVGWVFLLSFGACFFCFLSFLGCCLLFVVRCDDRCPLLLLVGGWWLVVGVCWW